MKPIFHSLGSNYSWPFIWLAFRQLWVTQPSAVEQTKKLLESKYHGRAQLFYKGRDAIEFALRAYGIGQNDQVLTQAFSCYAIEEAIKRAGAEAIFVDLAKHSLNPSVSTLQAAHKKAPHAKAVLIQHTLGYPAEIQKIAQWCQKNKLLLIEDLAQSLGAQDSDGIEVGTYGDVVICSFGRDKVIDAISGGAAILKTNSSFIDLAQDKRVYADHVQPKVPASIVKKDMFYPLLTWKIRVTHRFGIGKILFQIAKRIGLLTSPISSPIEHMSALPAEYAPLILWQFQHLSEQISHRQEIALLYDELMGHGKGLPLEMRTKEFVTGGLTKPSYLRYSFSIPRPQQLAQSLLSSQFYFTDRWYRQAVDSGSLNLYSTYTVGSCRESEKRAETIFNLPTHRYINKQSAERIMAAIINVLKTQN
jgi:perosamine synthetase